MNAILQKLTGGRLGGFSSERLITICAVIAIFIAAIGSSTYLAGTLWQIENDLPEHEFPRNRELMMLFSDVRRLDVVLEHLRQNPSSVEDIEQLQLMADILHVRSQQINLLFSDASVVPLQTNLAALIANIDEATSNNAVSRNAISSLIAQTTPLIDQAYDVFNLSSANALMRLESQGDLLDQLSRALIGILTAMAAGGIALISLVVRQRGTMAAYEEAKTSAENTRERLEDAIESISDGFAVFDPEDRLIACNQHYRDVYPAIADMLEPGVHYEELLWAMVMRNQVRVGLDQSAWVQRRLIMHRKGDGDPIEEQVGEDRWIRMAEHKTRDSGTVGTRTDITMMKQREEEMTRAKAQAEKWRERLENAIESISEGFVLWDQDDRLVMVNRRYKEFYPEIADRMVYGVARTDISAATTSGELRVEDQLGRSYNPVERYGDATEQQLTDGRWLRVSDYQTKDGDVVSLQADITVLKRRERELEESEQQYRALTSAAPVGIWSFDAFGKTQYANGAMLELLQLDTLQDLNRKHYREYLLPDHRKALEKSLRTVGLEETVHIEADLIGSMGAVTNGFLSAVSVPRPEGGPPNILATVLDITHRKKAEAKVQHLAHHDALTDLPNRVLFAETLESTLAEADQNGTSFALLGLDLDHFKDVNDTLGHDIGDKLLQGASERLCSCVRSGDMVARLGGDEFAVILRGNVDSDSAARVSRKIIDKLVTPYNLDGTKVHSGGSVGIALYPGASKDVSELMRHADMALYQAKQAGRHNFRFFTEDMSAQVLRRKQLEEDLREALEFERLTVEYQPQFDVAQNRICGVEALARWYHPEYGRINPAEFIEIAETTGLILPLGAWILRRACLQSYAWRQVGLEQIRVGVNLSAVQFKQPELSSLVRHVMDETCMTADLLELEITEGVLVNDNRTTTNTLKRLREMGVSLAIDDFGKGFSSLNYLKRFPAHKIKIDQDFVRDLGRSGSDDAIVTAVIELGKSLGMRVTAEGVENPQQLAFLKTKGCDEVQGYYVGKPMTADKVSDMLLARQHATRHHNTPPVRRRKKVA